MTNIDFLGVAIQSPPLGGCSLSEWEVRSVERRHAYVSVSRCTWQLNFGNERGRQVISPKLTEVGARCLEGVEDQSAQLLS